jgi:hypothetical protein
MARSGGNGKEPTATEKRTEPLQLGSVTRAECESERHDLCPGVIHDGQHGARLTLWICTCGCHRA